ncbi:DUF6538 domain-containing protein [Paraburkholderia phytofirmans]|uniref:DUF6538 domain-containing protein n=1 Tax=Paraburkholderia phytofirmans TaxID=261302 RepID=UPI0038992E90
MDATQRHNLSTCTHLIKRGSRYYLRRRVPSDLIPVLGKSEITKALGTSDRGLAVVLCRPRCRFATRQ